MIFKLTPENDSWLEKKYVAAMADLGRFFDIDWNRNMPRIITLPDRKTFDLYKKRRTESWVVGFAAGNNVYLLDRKNFDKESSHKYSPRHYSALLKHEICHLYIDILTKGFDNPRWLNEGICIYLSGQLVEYKKPEKLDTFLELYDKNGENLYRESGFAVQILIEKYGVKKLLKLLKGLTIRPNKQKFNELFEETYTVKPSYSLFQS